MTLYRLSMLIEAETLDAVQTAVTDKATAIRDDLLVYSVGPWYITEVVECGKTS